MFSSHGSLLTNAMYHHGETVIVLNLNSLHQNMKEEFELRVLIWYILSIIDLDIWCQGCMRIPSRVLWSIHHKQHLCHIWRPQSKNERGVHITSCQAKFRICDLDLWLKVHIGELNSLHTIGSHCTKFEKTLPKRKTQNGTKMDKIFAIVLRF